MVPCDDCGFVPCVLLYLDEKILFISTEARMENHTGWNDCRWTLDDLLL